MRFIECELVEGGVASEDKVYYKTGFCHSLETKPTGEAAADIAMGSCLIEVDTGDAYLFNETTGAWVKQ